MAVSRSYFASSSSQNAAAGPYLPPSLSVPQVVVSKNNLWFALSHCIFKDITLPLYYVLLVLPSSDARIYTDQGVEAAFICLDTISYQLWNVIVNICESLVRFNCSTQ